VETGTSKTATVDKIWVQVIVSNALIGKTTKLNREEGEEKKCTKKLNPVLLLPVH